MTDFSGLFTPIQLGRFTLPNRFIFPPMGLEVCEGGVPGPEAAEYYARRAAGGASLVITEGVYIDHPSSGDNPLLGRFHGEDAFAAWRHVASCVHEAGGLCVPELWHVGLIFSGPDVLAGNDLACAIELDESDGCCAQRAARINRAEVADVGVHCALFDKQVSRDMLVPGREIDRPSPGARGNHIDPVLGRRGLVLH